MAYRFAAEHMNSVGEIWLIDSWDNGQTWSNARPEVKWSWDSRDPSLTRLANGTLLLTWFTYNWGESRPEALWVLRSSDQGVTWSHPATRITSTNLPYPATSAKATQLSNGHILLPIYGKVNGVYRTVLIRSTNSGVSWGGSGGEVVVAQESGTHFEEPAVAELEPGHLRVLMRTHDTDANYTPEQAFQADSYNYSYMSASSWTRQGLGVTMAAPELFRIPGTNKVPYLWTDDPGRHVMVRMRYLDRGWNDTSSERMHQAGGDGGYSSTIMLDSSTLFTVFYDLSQANGVILGRTTKISDWEGRYTPKIDLRGKLQRHEISITTDMTKTDTAHPETGPSAVFDGSQAFWNSAFREVAATPTTPAVFLIGPGVASPAGTLTFGKIGICLKTDKAESAIVEASNDGVAWTQIQTYSNAATGSAVDVRLFGTTKSAKYLRVTITSSSGGWAGLNEIELWGFQPYGFGRVQNP